MVKLTFVEHIFSKHLLQANPQLQVQLKNNVEEIWTSIFLLIAFSLLVFIKTTSLTKVIKIIQSSFSSQAWQQLQREDYNPYKFYSVILALLFAFNVSFLLYKLNIIYKVIFINLPHILQFTSIFIILLALIFTKIVGNKLLIFLTGHKTVIHQYSYYSFIINQSFGLFIFPCIVLAEFSKLNSLYFLWAAVIIMAISLLLKWFKGIVYTLVEENIGILQTFVYFCILEILPVFVLVKIIIQTF